MEDEERAEFERLAVFLGTAAANPGSFRPQGKNAARVRSIIKRVTGPAQRPTRRKPRSQGQQKRDRQARRELAAAYNAAVAQMEADQAEAEKYHAEVMARIEGQPKFNIVADNGQVILADVPEEFIQRVEGSDPEAAKSAIVLPATAEKAMEREAGGEIPAKGFPAPSW